MGLIIKDLTPNDLNEITNKFPELKKYALPKPQSSIASEDRETGLISLLIPCIPPLLLLIKEIIAYKRESKKLKNTSVQNNLVIVTDKIDDPEVLKRITDILLVKHNE